jgi:hypothetical protein
MSFQLTSLRCSQGAPAKRSKHIFIENSKKMKF